MAKEKGSVTPGLQEYLTAIYRLKRRGKKVVRVKQLAEELGVKLSSVTDAAKRLSSMGLIHYERYGYLDLTEEGEKIASQVLEKEEVFRRFLTEFLGIDMEIADEEACWVEHGLSDITIDRIKALMKFLEQHCENFEKRFRDFVAEELH